MKKLLLLSMMAFGLIITTSSAQTADSLYTLSITDSNVTFVGQSSGVPPYLTLYQIASDPGYTNDYQFAGPFVVNDSTQSDTLTFEGLLPTTFYYLRFITIGTISPNDTMEITFTTLAGPAGPAQVSNLLIGLETQSGGRITADWNTNGSSSLVTFYQSHDSINWSIYGSVISHTSGFGTDTVFITGENPNDTSYYFATIVNTAFPTDFDTSNVGMLVT